jgi:hypothetical protein
VDTSKQPGHFVGGQVYEVMTMLMCQRCDRRGASTVMGRALSKSGLVYFQNRENARNLESFAGTPDLDRMGDGTIKVRNNWKWAEVIGVGFQLSCPDCESTPVVNAHDLALTVGEAIAKSGNLSVGVPVLVDPFGGARVAHP